MATRLQQQTDDKLIQDIKQLDATVRELKTGVQFTEARMYEYSSANAYDLTGSLAASSGGRTVLATLVVTITSNDNTNFLATCTPEFWIPDMNTPYRDTLTSAYSIPSNKLISDDVTKLQFWYSINAENAVSASTFYFKAHIYSTAPVTVTYARTV